MLTFRRAGAHRASRSAARIGAALALSVLTSLMTSTSAPAQDIRTGGCLGAANAFSCVTRWGTAGDPFIRIVPQPLDAEERDRATARDRRWVDRCRPIIRPDRYGVARYHYAAPGCEFGIGAY